MVFIYFLQFLIISIVLFTAFGSVYLNIFEKKEKKGILKQKNMLN